jgi:hypothetical protein
MDNLDWLGLAKGVADVGKNGFVEDKVQKERWAHCKDCTFLSYYNQCKKCGCFMNLKTKVKSAKCPIGIW